jgi:hypothetical protein
MFRWARVPALAAVTRLAVFAGIGAPLVPLGQKFFAELFSKKATACLNIDLRDEQLKLALDVLVAAFNAQKVK